MARLTKRRLRALKDDVEQLDLSAARTTLEEVMQTSEGPDAGKSLGNRNQVAAALKAIRANWLGGVKRRVDEIEVSDVHEWLATQEAYLA